MLNYPLKTVCTSHFPFEPIEFLEKLAALIPRPGVNLLLYHGVLAARAHWRAHVLGYGRPAPDTVTRQACPVVSTHTWSWAVLMRRALGLDVLACPRCGGHVFSLVKNGTPIGPGRMVVVPWRR